MTAHGAVIHAALAEEQNHNDGKQRVKIERNGADKQIKAAVILHHTGDRGRPGRDGGDHADGGCGGIDEIAELGAGDAVAVGHGTHYAADGEAVEVVIDKDENAQQEGGKHGDAAGPDVRLGPPAEGCGAARLIEQGDQDAQQHQEHEDAGVIADGGHDAVIEQRIQRFHMEAGVEQRAGHRADEQGAVDFLGDEREADGDDGGDQSPKSTEHDDFLLK